MQKIRREDEKGAMGVGTLIIFIAMVLVAAVAAGVLINTANQLQQQAQRTGSEAIDEVSSAFRVVDVYGQNTDDEGTINNVTLKVTLAAGANPQDLNKTTVQVMSGDGEDNLNAENISEGIRPDDPDVEFIEAGELIKFTINIDDIDDIEPLGPQDTLDVNIIPKHGTPTYEGIKAPSAITTEYVSF